MEVTTSLSTPHRQMGGMLLKLDDDSAAFVPLHINFTVDGLDWDVSGVVFTDVDSERSPEEAVPELHSLTIQQRKGGPPVDATALRKLKVGQLVDKVVEDASVPYERVGDKLIPVDGPTRTDTAQRARARQGRNVTDDDLLVFVAAYRKASSEGRTDLLQAMKEDLNMSVSTASRRRALARKRGFLKEDE